MNKQRTLSWTEIDTSDVGDDTENLQLDLSKDLEEDDEVSEFKEESQDTRRAILTVSDGKKDETKKNVKTRAEVEEDQDSGETGDEQTGETQVENKREGRAHKRIKTLLGRLSEKDRLLAEREAQIAQLTQRSRNTEKTSVNLQRDQWKEIIEVKKNALAEAADKSDGKEMARLSQEIADAVMKYNAFNAVSEDFENEPEPEQPQRRQFTPADVPEAAREWAARNPWFKTDPTKHVIARMQSAQLTQEGELDPADDEYWEELDKRIENEVNRMAGKTKQEQPQEKIQAKRKGSPLGSRNDEDSESPVRLDTQFKRVGGKIQGTPTQADRDMADKFGLNLKDFMEEKYKYAKQDYKGYVTIDVPGQGK